MTVFELRHRVDREATKFRWQVVKMTLETGCIWMKEGAARYKDLGLESAPDVGSVVTKEQLDQ